MQIKLLFFFLMLSLCGFAQIKVDYFENGSLKKQFEAPDSLSALKTIQKFQLNKVSEGYFFIGIDSITQKTTNRWSVFIGKGSKFSNKMAINGKKIKNAVKYLKEKVDELGESGYPFATVRLDSFLLEKNMLNANLLVDKGELIKYDSISMINKIKTKKTFIQKHLGIIQNDIFSEKNYKNIPVKIQQLSFLELKKSADIAFQGSLATIYLDLEEKKTTFFEGIIGLQPKENQAISFIGSLDLKTENLFHSGKKLHFHWEKFANNSQELRLNYEHPYLFNISVSPAINFEILKQNSVFLTRNWGINFSFYPVDNIKMTIGYQNTNGSILSRSKEIVIKENFLDFNKNLYEMRFANYKYIQRNSLFRNRFFWSTKLSIGDKSILRNALLSKSFYDSIKLKTLFFKADMLLGYDLRIWKSLALSQTISGGWLNNENLATNELYRIGGLKSMRGFLEKELYADYFCLARSELRAFFEEKSYFYIFYDQSIVHKIKNNFPLSIGVGLELETSIGQFNFALATGKGANRSLFDNGIKVHFGYVSIF